MNDSIREFMKNKYGSFILLKVMQIVDQTYYNLIIEAIRRNINHIHTANFK